MQKNIVIFAGGSVFTSLCFLFTAERGLGVAFLGGLVIGLVVAFSFIKKTVDTVKGIRVGKGKVVKMPKVVDPFEEELANGLMQLGAKEDAAWAATKKVVGTGVKDFNEAFKLAVSMLRKRAA